MENLNWSLLKLTWWDDSNLNLLNFFLLIFLQKKFHTLFWLFFLARKNLFLTRLAGTSNLKITQLSPTWQLMTWLARDLNIFCFDPSLKASQLPYSKLSTYSIVCPHFKTYPIQTHYEHSILLTCQEWRNILKIKRPAESKI